MRPPEAAAHLHDVLGALERIERFVSGRSLEDYLGDELLRSAVERQLGIVGEALGRALRAHAGLEGRVTDARRIVDFRNRLIHGYATVSDEVVWGVIEGSLERLRGEVASLLADLR